MNENELKIAIINLLYDLHSYDKLTLRILNSITHNFKVDAVEICEEEGITYFIE